MMLKYVVIAFIYIVLVGIAFVAAISAVGL